MVMMLNAIVESFLLAKLEMFIFWLLFPFLSVDPHRPYDGCRGSCGRRRRFWSPRRSVEKTASALCGKGWQVQRPPRKRAWNLPLPIGHLHHARGLKVAPQSAGLHAGLHHHLGVFWLHLVAHRLHPWRPGPHWWQRVDAVCRQPQWLRLSLPFFHRDRDHHWLWVPFHNRKMPRGHHLASGAGHLGLHRQCLHGGLHVCENLSTK